MEGHDESTRQLIQRFLSRMDFIEHTLVNQNIGSMRDDIQAIRDDMRRTERARILEAEDAFIADALAAAPRPTRVQDTASTPAQAPTPAPASAPPAPAPQASGDPVNPFAIGVGHRGPGADPPRPGRFSNSLVRSRPQSATTSPVQAQPSITASMAEGAPLYQEGDAPGQVQSPPPRTCPQPDSWNATTTRTTASEAAPGDAAPSHLQSPQPLRFALSPAGDQPSGGRPAPRKKLNIYNPDVTEDVNE